MKLDLLLAVVVAVFGLFGMLSGAIKQLRHWVGLIFAAFTTRPLAARLAPGLAPRLGLSPQVAYVGLSALLFCLFYLVGSAIASGILEEMFPDRQDGEGDHAFGFVLGAAKGAALLFVLLSFLVFFEKPLTRTFGAPPPDVRESRAVALVRRHDLFVAVPVPGLAKLEKLIEAAKDPQGRRGLENEPELRRLLDDPKLKAALRDGELSRAMKSGDLSSFKSDPRLRALLNDLGLASPKSPSSP